MLDASLFISSEVEERTVEMADGSKHVLHFKQLPNSVMEKFARWNNSADEDVVATASAKLLSLALCDADGKPVIDAETAERIKPQVMNQMIRAALEVNGYGRKKDDLGKS